MIMAPGKFEVTPQCYNQQFEYDFRQVDEKISYLQLEKTRRKVMKWIKDNNQHFAL
jgi:uncharacterized protein (DUF2225 family)